MREFIETSGWLWCSMEGGGPRCQTDDRPTLITFVLHTGGLRDLLLHMWHAEYLLPRLQDRHCSARHGRCVCVFALALSTRFMCSTIRMYSFYSHATHLSIDTHTTSKKSCTHIHSHTHTPCCCSPASGLLHAHQVAQVEHVGGDPRRSEGLPDKSGRN
jgi:hypothetical protein